MALAAVKWRWLTHRVAVADHGARVLSLGLIEHEDGIHQGRQEPKPAAAAGRCRENARCDRNSASSANEEAEKTAQSAPWKHSERQRKELWWD